MSKSLFIRVFSVGIFPVILGIMAVVGVIISVRAKLITPLDDEFSVSSEGMIVIYKTEAIIEDIMDIKVKPHSDLSKQGFILDYYMFDEYHGSLEVIIESDIDFEFEISDDDRMTIGTIRHSEQGTFYFIQNTVTEGDTVLPGFYVSSIQNRNSVIYWMIFYLLIWIVCILNVVHLIWIQKNYVFKTSPNISVLEKVGILLLGLFIPIGGQIFYIAGATNLYNTKRVRRGTYAAIGLGLSVLIISTTLLLIFII